MTLKRLAIFLFLPILIFSLWTMPAFADQQNVSIFGSGECKIDANYKKAIGVQASLALAKVHNRYMRYVEFLQKEYEGDGVCHHLHNPGNHNGLISLSGSLLDMLPIDISELSFLHGLEDADELEWTDYDRAGAKAIDTEEQYSAVRGGAAYKALTAAGTNCSGVLSKVETNPWKDYTDYHIQKMVNMSKKVLDIAVSRYKEAQSEGKATSQMANDLKNYESCYKKALEAETYRNGKDGFIQNRKLAEMYLSILGGADTQCECQRDSDGNPTDKVKQCWSLQKTVDDNLKQVCKTIAQYQKEMGDLCITCGIMAKILGAAQRISKSAFTVLASDLSKVLYVAFLIFLAYTVLLVVASPETQKLSKFLTTILMQGGKVAIAVLILSNPEYLYDKAINPILESGVDFGLAFSNIKANNEGDTSMDSTLSEQIKTVAADYAGDFDASSKFLSAFTLEKLVGANKNFSKEAALMPAIGRCMICNSTYNLPIDFPHFGVLPRFKMLATGVLLMVFGMMIWLAIGFYILDCCLQLCLIVAMMPFFVACWPFKITNSYVKVGWNMFLNTFFNFVMMSVVIVTIALLTFEAVPADLQQDINEDNVDNINDQLQVIGLDMLVLITACLICLKLSSEAGRLANKFAGGAKIKMGAELGGMAGDMAKKVTVGNLGKSGKDGKQEGLGGALGLAKRGVGSVIGSAAESSGAKGAISAKAQAIKGAFGGAAKSKSASFKQSSAESSGGDKTTNSK